jgi:hypothetical protein
MAKAAKGKGAAAQKIKAGPSGKMNKGQKVGQQPAGVTHRGNPSARSNYAK